MKNTAKAAEIALALTDMGWEHRGQFYTVKNKSKRRFIRCKLKGHTALFYTYQWNRDLRGKCMDFTRFRYSKTDSVHNAIAHAKAQMQVLDDTPRDPSYGYSDSEWAWLQSPKVMA